MSFSAQVLRVLIASPSDVNAERNEIEKIIFEWNSQYSEEMGIILLPGRWENDVTPTYKGGEGGQEVINEQLVRKCDILIGVFWTKLGTPTLRHSSGTLEEIEIFINEGKEVMVYFVDRDVPRLGINYDELVKVDEYKDEYAKKGVYGSYDTQKIHKDLYKKVSEYKKELVSKAEQEKSLETALPIVTEPKNMLTVVEPTQDSLVFELVTTDSLTERECLLIEYILQTENRQLGARWMATQTVIKIEAWQTKNALVSDLDVGTYQETLDSLMERKLIEVTETTGYGNPRLFTMPLFIFNQFRSLPSQLRGKISSTVNNKYLCF